MTISEPIPVAEAIKAVHAAIEVCGGMYEGVLFVQKEAGEGAGMYPSTKGTVWVRGGNAYPEKYGACVATNLNHNVANFIVAARAGYAGALEYFLWLLNDMTGSGGIEEIDDGYAAYAAVAPIVEWYRQTGAQGGTR